MRKLLVLLIVTCLLLPIGSVTYAAPDDVIQEEDKTIPPVEGYKFNMTPDNVHDLLGLPDEKGGEFGMPYETYYYADYYDLDGHLTFYYDDNQIFNVCWESPEIDEPKVKEITSTVEKYYDEKIGVNDEQKIITENNDLVIYTWTDAFNKTDYSLQISTKDNKTQITITMSKSISPADIAINAVTESLNESGMDMDEMIAAIKDSMN